MSDQDYQKLDKRIKALEERLGNTSEKTEKKPTQKAQEKKAKKTNQTDQVSPTEN